MIRTKGEPGTGNVVEAVRHMRTVQREIAFLSALDPAELMSEAKKMGAPFSLVQAIAVNKALPVPNFAAGGIATPADAALMMQLGAETVFVGSGIFKSGDPAKRAKCVTKAQKPSEGEGVRFIKDDDGTWWWLTMALQRGSRGFADANPSSIPG